MGRRGALLLGLAASIALAAGLLAPASQATSPKAAFPKATAPKAAAPTPDEAIHNLRFARSDVGYILFDVQSKRVLAEQNADQLFLPASVSKLPTVYAALEILGPDFRFSTTLWRRGSDLYLKGGGDPLLASTDLAALVTQLKAAPPQDMGVQNASLADPPPRFFYDDSLMKSLPEISARQPMAVAYNPGLSALDVDFNRVEADWQLKANGKSSFRALCVADRMILPAGWIEFHPATGDVPAQMPFLYTGSTSLDRWHYSPHIEDHGSTFLPVKAASPHAARLFRELARAQGVTLPLPEPGQVPPDAVPIARIDSRPLAEIIRDMLRYSNNLSAELVGLAASRKLTGDPLDLAQSAAALTGWLKERELKADWRGYFLANHSGLSPDSRVTPRQMALLLTLISEDDALVQAIPGLTGDGRATLADNPRGLIGKSGTMDYARGLAGYFLAKDGRPLGFAIFIFDRAQRAVLDAAMDTRVVESSPAARAWTHRALQVDQILLADWMRRF
jgi:serine-type D-Ala-D-Ala carboxypeptidase/endopeptidase (penicillin-binding protein 4)